jgi:hypothetical protein
MPKLPNPLGVVLKKGWALDVLARFVRRSKQIVKESSIPEPSPPARDSVRLHTLGLLHLNVHPHPGVNAVLKVMCSFGEPGHQ